MIHWMDMLANMLEDTSDDKLDGNVRGYVRCIRKSYVVRGYVYRIEDTLEDTLAKQKINKVRFCQLVRI